ncbi:transcriptional activator RfaH [Enterovibrio norvegicus]|uniref:transcription/translation regulatory transformer protein RfaH n=1 Tax=Enterovibrio norvegicus TaxID=188144 RepID=UPI000C8641FD|nr:transcription/translation regulatory transformer protein RfaH [Enterovibrio norvegicus]MCC4797858.1 transcription/translation regulatory transformer protein RfaH [Enterovibrio norvegicus]PMI32999.1 transcriptional activator RfaH [Enterovibrio norvegicus]PMI34891.1 transcriptional activator RfaH [Enterovibrio norvegicus]PMN45098.1 transcriptional activator RfaH [Enterovibrio norvegicus]
MNPWYLLYCKRSEQQRAEQHLKRQGVDCYYPQVSVEKIRRGKRSSILEPLFPNYVFASFDPEKISFTTIRSTRGVVDFVRTGAQPQLVPLDLIKNLMVIEDNDDQRESLSQVWKHGDAIAISQGQFEGMEAIYKEADGELRSILMINLLNKQVEVSLENEILDNK